MTVSPVWMLSFQTKKKNIPRMFLILDSFDCCDVWQFCLIHWQLLKLRFAAAERQKHVSEHKWAMVDFFWTHIYLDQPGFTKNHIVIFKLINNRKHRKKIKAKTQLGWTLFQSITSYQSRRYVICIWVNWEVRLT